MTIEELKAERIAFEDQMQPLKKQYDRVDSEVNLHGWREATPEEKEMMEAYQQKLIELKQLIVSQIKRVVDTKDSSLIEDYYTSIPEKYEELKILLISHKKFDDGQIMDILNKYMNSDFLTGSEPNPYVSEEDFGNAVAMLGPDGIKIEYLNSILKIKGSNEVVVNSLELSKLDDYILKIIAGFSSQEVAMELFSCIFNFGNSNPSIIEELCLRFASLIEQYQEKRTQYDVEAIGPDNRIMNFDRYYLINFQSFHNMLVTLPEINKSIVSDLSIKNAERVRQKIKQRKLNKQEMTSYLLYNYLVLEPYKLKDNDNKDDLSVAEIIDGIIAQGDPAFVIKDDEKEQAPSIIAAPVENEEIVVNPIIQNIAGQSVIRRIHKLPNPIRIVRKTQQYSIYPSQEDYKRLIEQRIVERGIVDSISEEEIKEQDYQKFKKAILEIMDLNNSADKSIEELALLISNNPDVIYYKTKYGNNKDIDSQSVGTTAQPHTK